MPISVLTKIAVQTCACLCVFVSRCRMWATCQRVIGTLTALFLLGWVCLPLCNWVVWPRGREVERSPAGWQNKVWEELNVSKNSSLKENNTLQNSHRLIQYWFHYVACVTSGGQCCWESWERSLTQRMFLLHMEGLDMVSRNNTEMLRNVKNSSAKWSH